MERREKSSSNNGLLAPTWKISPRRRLVEMTTLKNFIYIVFTNLVNILVMNIEAMIALPVVIAIEKSWTTSEAVPQAVGLMCFFLTVAVIWFPGLAPGLIANTGAMNMVN